MKTSPSVWTGRVLSGAIAYKRTDLPPQTGSFGEVEPSAAELARRERWAREG